MVNLERDLFKLRCELASVTGRNIGFDTVNTLTTEECDGGEVGDNADSLRKQISTKERSLLVERRSVFRGWLKNVFLGQAILSLGLSLIMVTNPSILFGTFDWYEDLHL